MNTIVIFTENNARIIKAEDIAEYKQWPNAIINPDLHDVRGIPPHFWKLENNRIVPMKNIERAVRLKALEFGAVNTIAKKERPNKILQILKIYRKEIFSFVLGAAIAALITIIKGAN